MTSRKKLKCLSLFTGMGGLDIGLEAAGISTKACIEIDPLARETIRKNRPNWGLMHKGDIHNISGKELLTKAQAKRREIFLLAGGPPCQPYSKAAYWHSGKTKRLSDPRASTLEAYLSILNDTLPEVLLLENVKGIAYEGKDEAINLLNEELVKINAANGTNYVPTIHQVNCAEYGVPQLRERVFIIAQRDGQLFKLPSLTHGPKTKKPYINCWDAISDLEYEADESLNLKGKWAGLLPSIPEGQNYLWHTNRLGGLPLFGWRTRYWSFLLKIAKSKPSWTIPASPGPSTGPFHWNNRKLSVRELCRIQTIPDDYKVQGSLLEAQKQIGNAVPSLIGELLGLEIRRQFLGQRVRKKLKLEITPQAKCGDITPHLPVAEEYLPLIGEYAAHPGTGKGPGAILNTQLEA